MADPFFGEIRMFGFNYAPVDWAFCDGSVINVMQNQALYSIIGNTYGGTVGQTFAMPNLMGQAVMGTGISPASGNDYLLNNKTGLSSVTLNLTQVPQHDHTGNVYTGPATTTSPDSANIPAVSPPGAALPYINYTKAGPKPDMTTLSPSAMATVGLFTPQAHENRQPFLVMNFCICTYGVYPNFD
jgi:microcystin-dependent protein